MFKYYLQLAWKSLIGTPVVTLLMLLAIALGIASSIGTLSIYHMMSMDPIPEKSQQLFALQLKSYDENQTSWGGYDDGFPAQITYQDAVNLRRSNIAKRQTAMLRITFAIQLADSDIAPKLERSRVADSEFFSMFNAEFAYGGTWDKNIDEQGQEVVVIGERLNRELFGGGDNVGKQVLLNQKPFTIVGILKYWQPTPMFYDVNGGGFNKTEQIFIPFSLLPIHEYPSSGNNSSWKYEDIFTYQDKLQSETHWIQYWVELSDKAEKANYQDYLKAYIEDQKQAGRFAHKDAAADLKNVRQWLSYNEVVSKDNSVLVGLSFLLLVVCLVNTIGLLLAKFLRRAPEIGVRRALGASQSQVFIQHLVEVGLLGLMGGTIGIVLTQLALWLLRTNYSNYELTANMDMAMVLTAPTIAILATVLAGLYPAWKICRTQPSIYLKCQ
ncbi:MAG: ABC transporter permease [Colwellia sp.]|nr:ABC transporter permease [Colwellia sp.]